MRELTQQQLESIHAGVDTHGAHYDRGLVDGFVFGAILGGGLALATWGLKEVFSTAVGGGIVGAIFGLLVLGNARTIYDENF